MERLRCIVLLAGGYRPRDLPSRLGRSVLDLPVAKSLRLSDIWRLRIREFLQESVGASTHPEVRVLLGPSSPLPTEHGPVEDLPLRHEHDASGYRGTAGVLRDLCEQFEDQDYVLVGTASQCPDAGMLRLLVTASDVRDGVTLTAAPGGEPSGLMLVRCDSLRGISAVGYVDLKEQALPRIAVESGVRVVKVPGGVSRPIRDIGSYLDAVRSWHRYGSLRGVRSADPFEERWRPAFSLVEEGAKVGDQARLYDSVVLAGGTVASDCDVVRSVVGPGGVVGRRQRVVERLVLPAETSRRSRGRLFRRRGE